MKDSNKQFQDDYRCDGQYVIVTGGGTGIGRATALAFLASGAKRVLITGRRVSKLQEVAALATDQGYAGQLEYCVADVTKPADRHKIAEHARAWGQLDVLINNAGAFVYESVGDSSDESIRHMFEVNTIAPTALIRDCLPLLEKTKGSITNVSSTLAAKPIPNTSTYNGAKAAIIQITKTLAFELGSKQVRINSVLPAVVDTPMYQDRFDTEEEHRKTMDSMAEQHPLGRVGLPKDIAQSIIFLSSPAASWITGVALPVDGGMLCT